MLKKFLVLLLTSQLFLFNVTPAIAGHAIILSDAELDQIHAGGLNFSFDSFLGNFGNTANNVLAGDTSNKGSNGLLDSIVSFTPNSNVKIISAGGETQPANSGSGNSQASTMNNAANDAIGQTNSAGQPVNVIPTSNVFESAANSINAAPVTTGVPVNTGGSAPLPTPELIAAPMSAVGNSASANNSIPQRNATNTLSNPLQKVIVPPNLIPTGFNSPATNNSPVKQVAAANFEPAISTDAAINDAVNNNATNTLNDTTAAAPVQLDVLASNGGIQLGVPDQLANKPTVENLIPNGRTGLTNFGGNNVVNIDDAAQKNLQALVNINAAGSVVPVLLNLTVVINSNVESLSNYNNLNLTNLTSTAFQFR